MDVDFTWKKNLYHHNHQIVSYIKKKHLVLILRVSGLHKWLHRNGFTYKKPKGRPHKIDVQKQDAFIKEYETQNRTAVSDEPIMFMDSVHPTQATKISYGWIKRAKKKKLKAQ